MEENTSNDKTEFTTHILTLTPFFFFFLNIPKYSPQGLLARKEKHLLMIWLKSKIKIYSCLPQRCPPTAHLWVFKMKDFRNVKNN